MTRDEFEKKLIAVLGEAMLAGYLHSMVFMGSTKEHLIMLTNMGQKTTIRFIMHMGEHALNDGEHSGMVAYNLATGEKHEDEVASESFKTGVGPKRKKAH